MGLSNPRVRKKRNKGNVESSNLGETENKLKTKKEPKEVTPPTCSIPWSGLPSTSAYPRWQPPMYGMGQPMYQGMVGG